MICFFCGRFTVPGWGPGWNVFSEGTEKWTQWHFLCEVYSRQHLKGHCSCSPNPADMVRPQQILSCGRQLAKLTAGSFSTTHNTPPLWFGEPSRRNGHSSVLWAQACRRCPFLPSDCLPHWIKSKVLVSISGLRSLLRKCGNCFWFQ